jgi:hypothetical protein
MASFKTLITGLLLFFSAAVNAQQLPPTPASKPDSVAATAGPDEMPPAAAQQAVLAAQNGSEESALVQAAFCEDQRTKVALQQYFQQSLRHRQRTFQWQYTSGIIIFWVVIATVLCGLVYSGFQFYYSIQAIKFRQRMALLQREGAGPASGVAEEAATTFEASAGGVKVSSSLVGLLILIVSIAFFFLYLTHVYPIDEMRVDNQPVQETLVLPAAP